MEVEEKNDSDLNQDKSNNQSQEDKNIADEENVHSSHDRTGFGSK